ncbi:MAG: hypothetical protein H7Y38_09225 [Armatimonadetes bacterium]|nr:hypothetical protein [Armatimonadota bacterium]
MNHYVKTKNIVVSIFCVSCVSLLAGCAKEEEKAVVAPVLPPAANAPASAAGAPSTEMLEREKQNAALSLKNNKEGEQKFKEYLKNKK